jgi:hypothetical protein
VIDWRVNLRTTLWLARENTSNARDSFQEPPLDIAMRTALALLLLVLSLNAQATLWRVDAVLSAYGLNNETPYQKTKFAVQGTFDTENGEPLWWDIDVILPRDVFALDSACNAFTEHCSGKSIRGGFTFTFSSGSPSGAWYLTLVSAGVLTSAQFYHGGIGGFEGELEHGTMITVDIPEPSTILFILVALGFVVARARTVFVKAVASKKAGSLDRHPHGNTREQFLRHGMCSENNQGVLES